MTTSKLKISCFACKKEFFVFPYRRTTAKFCSFSCAGKFARKGKTNSSEHKRKIEEGRKKFTYTEEIRLKMSLLKKGCTPWNKGKKMTAEYGQRIAEILRGKTGENSRNWKGGKTYFSIRAKRLRENGGSHSKSEWEQLKEEYHHTCPSCIRTGIELVKDHIIPIAKGGSNNIENIQPLCRSCNAKKHTQEVRFPKLVT